MAEQYDAIVVGSGACGGWASMALAQAGMKVLMLEAGSPIQLTDFHHTFLYQLKFRGRGAPGLLRRYSGSERNYRIMLDNPEPIHDGSRDVLPMGSIALPGRSKPALGACLGPHGRLRI